MTKATVAIVTPSFPPMIGGIENYVLGVGKELVAIGHEVSVYTPDSVLGRTIPVSREVVEGLEVHRVRVPVDLSYRMKIWPDLVGELKRSGCEIIHVYSHDSYAFFALLASRATGAPMLLTTYGPLSTHAQYGRLQSGLFDLYDLVASPALFRGCELVMMRYPAIEKWLLSMGVPREKLRLEPSGIPRECMGQRDGAPFRVRHGIEGPLLLYLGRVSPQKGVGFAVQAMKTVSRSYPGARLMIIGPDYTGHSDELRTAAAVLGVSDKVIFLPPMVDEESQLEAIAAADLFVMPSSFEGFSQSVMKAMAQGKPVVATDVGGLPYEVDGGRCGVLCRYGDPEDLARGVVSILADPELGASMGREGRTRAALFTFDVLARNISEAYSQLER